MVIKGGARASPGELAFHLQRIDTNEQMEVCEMRGVLAEDLDGALREMQAVASGARCRKFLYHASINTRADEILSEEQRLRAVDRLEAGLGLTGQPRVVVAHVKEGRQHTHVVWQRIEFETMTAISDSHNYRIHEEVARALEREFGHQYVQGAHVGRDGEERKKRTPTLGEMKQGERSGITPAEAKAQLKELWKAADGGQAFAAALDDAEWILARGDKRGFVALDPAGETHAINKEITGLTAAAVRERLADIALDRLPSVEEARDRLADRRQADEATLSSLPTEPLRDAPGEAEEVLDNQTPAVASEAIQEASQEAEEATLPNRQDEISRFRRILEKAQEKLEALGNRLEAAFAKFRGILDRRRDQERGEGEDQNQERPKPLQAPEHDMEGSRYSSMQKSFVPDLKANFQADESEQNTETQREERIRRLTDELVRKWQKEQPKGPSR